MSTLNCRGGSALVNQEIDGMCKYNVRRQMRTLVQGQREYMILLVRLVYIGSEIIGGGPALIGTMSTHITKAPSFCTLPDSFPLSRITFA